MSPSLSCAIKAVQRYRQEVWERRNRPIPQKASDRYLFVGEDGDPLSRSGFNTSWQRMMGNALADSVLMPEDCFSLHGLKHRGVTDTKGDKKAASGHKTDSMIHVYDHSIIRVEPADG